MTDSPLVHLSQPSSLTDITCLTSMGIVHMATSPKVLSLDQTFLWAPWPSSQLSTEHLDVSQTAQTLQNWEPPPPTTHPLFPYLPSQEIDLPPSQNSNLKPGSHTRLLSNDWWCLCNAYPDCHLHWSNLPAFFPSYCITHLPSFSAFKPALLKCLHHKPDWFFPVQIKNYSPA